MRIGFAEGAITKLRREFKLLLSAERARALRERLVAELSGDFSQPTQVVTVYFDLPGMPLAAQALSTPDECVKLRTKEYFPDLGRTHADRAVLELKRERDGLTHKQRWWIERSRLRALVRGGAIATMLPGMESGPWVPVLAVSYTRHVYQQWAAWRMTLDTDVSFYSVGEEVALSEHRITLEQLGAPAWREPLVVAEVKHLGSGIPAWLAQLGQEEATRYSKFATGIGSLFTRAGHERSEGA